MSDDLLSFGSVEFDVMRGRLSVAGRQVGIDRSCAAVLSLLLREAGRDISKDRLLETGWPGRVVHENSLAKAIGRLRHALGEDAGALETVHGHGYRLTADLRRIPAAASGPRLLRRASRFRRLAASFAAVTLLAVAGLAGSVPLSDGAKADDSMRVINGELADSIGRVLWVDDHPPNNANEKRFLENRKVAVYQVRTSEDALALLAMYKYDAVISDMGRNDMPLAGIKLVREMRSRGHAAPFLLYTVHSSAAQRKLVAESGGQGVAVTSGELYAAILPLLREAKSTSDRDRS